MRASDLSEYTGELRASGRVRLVDLDGGFSDFAPDFPVAFDVPCVLSAAAIDKSLCDVAAAVDSVIPGAGFEGPRVIWAMDRVTVYDGGPDGDADTAG